MKRSLLLLIAIVLVAGVFAYDFSVNGIYYSIKAPASLNRVSVSIGSATGNSYSGAVTIPPTVTYNSKTYTVTEIGQWAFSASTDLTALTIPSTIDTISDGAFWGCVKVATIALPASLKKIGNYVFVGDTTLTDIIVDAANTRFRSDQGVLYNKNLNFLLSYPAGKPALSYTISSTVDSIGDFAFSYCKFTSVTIPNSVKYMNHGTFSMCYGLTTVTIPASVAFLKNNPFYDCKNMTAVNVDAANAENQSVDGVLFKKEAGQPLRTIIYYPPAKSGSSYSIPATVTYVRSGTFMNCLNLNTITIPASVNTIRSGAFEGCANLTTINTYSADPVDLTNTIPGYNSDKVFAGVDTLHCVLHVPVGSKNKYASAFQWKGFSNIVEGFAAGFSSTKASSLKVTALSGQISISGYTPGESICIFNAQGMLVYKQNTTATTTTIKLKTNGVYMIKAGNEKVKVFL